MKEKKEKHSNVSLMNPAPSWLASAHLLVAEGVQQTGPGITLTRRARPNLTSRLKTGS